MHVGTHHTFFKVYFNFELQSKQDLKSLLACLQRYWMCDMIEKHNVTQNMLLFRIASSAASNGTVCSFRQKAIKSDRKRMLFENSEICVNNMQLDTKTFVS